MTSYLRDTQTARTPRTRGVRDEFEVSSSVSVRVQVQVQKPQPGTMEQDQKEQVSVSGEEERSQSVPGQEQNRSVRELQRFPRSTPASEPGSAGIRERLGGRQKTETAALRERVEGSIVRVNPFY